MNVVEENTNKSENCYYLFELSIAAVCDAAPARGLSTGSVFCVVYVSQTRLVACRARKSLLPRVLHSSVLQLTVPFRSRFVCLVGVYLILGFIYQRLVVGAKGWEQVPNYAFWKDFGNLQAVSRMRVQKLENEMCVDEKQCGSARRRDALPPPPESYDFG